MRTLFSIMLIFPHFLIGQQFYVGNNALVHISGGANLEVGGDLENNGAIQNVGSLSLYGDWTVNNNFNGLEGKLQFLGNEDQTIYPQQQLVVKEMTINQGGFVNLLGSEYVVTDRIDFQFGRLRPGNTTSFILDQGINVTGGSSDSYFEGLLISRGGGIRKFPLGNDGVYSPIVLLDVFGNDIEISGRFTRNNPVAPIPGDSLLGVSHRGYWRVELLEGVSDESMVEVEFNEEDLTSFINRNDIRHKVKSPVIASASDLTDIWQSLGVQSLLDTDSLTYGTLQGEAPITLQKNSPVYLAVALAPRIPEEGLYYIPEAFSPQAIDPVNRSFKILGERISEQNFNLQVYNRLGVEVYSTDSFAEANENGWDGTNKRGYDEPTGIYYFQVRFEFFSGQSVERSGSLYLVR